MKLPMKFENRIDAWAFRFILFAAGLIGFEWVFRIVDHSELIVQIIIILVLGMLGLLKFATEEHDE